MRLGLRVRKVEFHETEDVLRVLGVIEQGPQDLGEHHTLIVEPGEAVNVIKPEWKAQHFDRIKRAVASSERPSIVLVSIEDTDAVIAAVREYGIKEHATITRNPQGKMYDSKPNEEEFLNAVVEKLKLLLKDEPLIILGPGFLKEALAKRLREKAPGMSASMSVLHTGQAGMAGIHELMKQGIGGKVFEESRVARETRLMEQLFAEIAKGGMFAYGDQQVMEAARSGAIATLLVLDTKVRTRSAEELLKTVEGSKGEFVVVSSMHEAGRRLESLGGVAAILRYRMG
jgi:protein pelota